MVNGCKDMGVQYTVHKKNVTKNFIRPYPLNNLDEFNMTADATGNPLGMLYNTHMIHCNIHYGSFNAVGKSTF